VRVFVLEKQGQRLLFCHTLLINLNNNTKLKAESTTTTTIRVTTMKSGKSLPHKMSNQKQLEMRSLILSLSLFHSLTCSLSLLSEFLV